MNDMIYILVEFGENDDYHYETNIKASFDGVALKKESHSLNNKLFDINELLKPYNAEVERKLKEFSNGKYTDYGKFYDIGGFEVEEVPLVSFKTELNV